MELGGNRKAINRVGIIIKMNIMKTKFFFPVLGAFAMTIAFAIPNNTSEAQQDAPGFLVGDNLAFAQDCGYKPKHYCIIDNRATYDEEFCGSIPDPGGTQ